MAKTKERIEEIRALLRESSAAVEDAVVFIYDRQTTSEKASKMTKEDNGVGFNGPDAELLSSFAEQIIDRRARGIKPGRCLSQPRHGREGQIGWARRKIAKYAGQLVREGWPGEREYERDAQIASNDRSPSRTSPKTFGKFASRYEALKDAWERVERGRQWILDNPDDHRFLAAQRRVVRLTAYAEQLVTDAAPEDIRLDEFRELARQVKPCAACAGTGTFEVAIAMGGEAPSSGVCYRCSGKGFQTVEDEQRNDKYDATHRGGR